METYGILITTMVGDTTGETRWYGENTIGRPITGSKAQMEQHLKDLGGSSIVLESVMYQIKLYKGQR